MIRSPLTSSKSPFPKQREHTFMEKMCCQSGLGKPTAVLPRPPMPTETSHKAAQLTRLEVF